MKNITKDIAKVLTNIFSRRRVESVARKEKFIKRKPRSLSAYDFFLALTLGRLKKSAYFVRSAYPVGSSQDLTLWFTPTIQCRSRWLYADAS